MGAPGSYFLASLRVDQQKKVRTVMVQKSGIVIVDQKLDYPIIYMV